MKTIHDRFMDKVSPEPNSGCWLWDAFTREDGYGQFRFNGRTQSAHRVAWQLYNGPLSRGASGSGVCVLHRCDNPACVNPEHLFIGSNADNVQDMVNKGRNQRCRGADASRSKLIDADVIAIRHFVKSGVPQNKIAIMFNVDNSTISDIKRRKSWSHLK
jgi:hypothetical protein